MPTQQDVDNAQAELDRLRAEADRVANQTNGANWKTENDIVKMVKGFARQEIYGNYHFKCEGGYQRVQLGLTHKVYALFKGEFITAFLNTLILIAELKFVGGLAYTSITGVKKDTVGGAKFDILHGIKFEKKASISKTIGASAEKKTEGNHTRRAERYIEKIGSFISKTSSTVRKTNKMVAKIGKLKKDVKILDAKFGALRKKVSSQKHNVGKAITDADNYHIDGTEFTLQGAPIFVAGDGEGSKLVGCYCLKRGGNYAQCGKGSAVVFHGSKHLLI